MQVQFGASMMTMLVAWCGAMAVVLFTALPAQAAKWCGTGGKSWRGIASNLIPETFPPLVEKSCPARLASVWKACRNHDQCYWNRNKRKDECDDQFPADIIAACGELIAPYRVLGVSIIVPAGCHRLRAKCAAIAATYSVGMRIAQGSSYAEAQREANAVLELIAAHVPDSSLQERAVLVNERIAHYCTLHAVDTLCPIAQVAQVVLSEIFAEP